MEGVIGLKLDIFGFKRVRSIEGIWCFFFIMGNYGDLGRYKKKMSKICYLRFFS